MSLEKDTYRLQITLVFVKIKNSSHLQIKLHFDNTHIPKERQSMERLQSSNSWAQLQMESAGAACIMIPS